jgi:PTS system fructose-specific IIA component
LAFRIQVVLAREESYSTAIGYGIALPHGQSQYVQSPFIAFAKSQDGFVWDDETGQEVRLIFLIGIPKEETNDLVFKMLAEIGRGLMNTYYREWLVEAMDEEETMAVFREMERLDRYRYRYHMQANSMILLQ